MSLHLRRCTDKLQRKYVLHTAETGLRMRNKHFESTMSIAFDTFQGIFRNINSASFLSAQ